MNYRYIIRVHNLSKYEIKHIIIVLIIKYYEKKAIIFERVLTRT